MELEQIKQKVENSEQFIYWNKEVGITFEDFKVIDVENNILRANGSNKIGSYEIMVLKDNKLQVCYDLTVESARAKRLEKVNATK